MVSSVPSMLTQARERIASLEVHAESHAISARRIGEITHACAAATLAIHRQEGALVPQVVDVQAALPAIGANAPAQVADVVRRQLGIEWNVGYVHRAKIDEPRRAGYGA